LTLTCSAIQGDLPLILYWKFGNKSIESIPGISVSAIGIRTSMLSIDAIQGYHSGRYECFGKNGAGISSYATEVVVNGW
jgi:Immunoglobulin domain